MKPCAHPLEGRECGQPAVAIVKVKQGKLTQQDRDQTIGRGVGTLWLPICEMHIASYPDYDGQRIEQ